MTLSARAFHGIIPPLVTPLADQDRLDVEGLERMVEHVVAGGVNGVFILGSTGEGPSLSYSLRRELIGRACELVGGRVPVLTGITDTSFTESVALAQIAAEAGATALVVAPPYYFPPSPEELTGYLRRLAAEAPLPLMLYNMPSLTHVWLDIETVRRLTEIPAIVGVKDSGGDLDYYRQLLELRAVRPDWSLLIGPEHLMSESVAMGGDGGVSGGANVFPELFVGCYEATIAGDAARRDELQQVIELFQGIYGVCDRVSRFVKATKSALSLRRLCEDRVAAPFEPFESSQRAAIAAVLERCLERLAVVRPVLS